MSQRGGVKRECERERAEARVPKDGSPRSPPQEARACSSLRASHSSALPAMRRVVHDVTDTMRRCRPPLALRRLLLPPLPGGVERSAPAAGSAAADTAPCGKRGIDPNPRGVSEPIRRNGSCSRKRRVPPGVLPSSAGGEGPPPAAARSAASRGAKKRPPPLGPTRGRPPPPCVLCARAPPSPATRTRGRYPQPAPAPGCPAPGFLPSSLALSASSEEPSREERRKSSSYEEKGRGSRTSEDAEPRSGGKSSASGMREAEDRLRSSSGLVTSSSSRLRRGVSRSLDFWEPADVCRLSGVSRCACRPRRGEAS